MFDFVTESKFNPLAGECQHNCDYGWCRELVRKYNLQKYVGVTRIDLKVLNRRFTADDVVFLCDMNDLFGAWVDRAQIKRILDYVSNSPATFLALTKNPARYLEFQLPSNLIAGATIECDCSQKIHSQAPPPLTRLLAFEELKHLYKMVCVEPIMDFSNVNRFGGLILRCKPQFVAVGYDNYKHGLPEPPLRMTNDLIEFLEEHGVYVFKKTLRECTPLIKKEAP